MTEFVKNCWYMAGWSEELAETIFSRRIFDRKIAFVVRAELGSGCFIRDCASNLIEFVTEPNP